MPFKNFQVGLYWFTLVYYLRLQDIPCEIKLEKNKKKKNERTKTSKN